MKEDEHPTWEEYEKEHRKEREKELVLSTFQLWSGHLLYRIQHIEKYKGAALSNAIHGVDSSFKELKEYLKKKGYEIT